MSGTDTSPPDIENAYEALACLQRETTATDLSTDEKIQRLLETTADALGFPIAYFTHIDGGKQRIVAAVGDHDGITSGAVDPLEETYCRRVVDMDSPVIVSDAEAAGWADDPAFERFGLQCYVGTRVEVGGTTYGSVCFADKSSRPGVDTDVVRTTVDLIAQWIGYELERTRHEQELQQRERKYRHLFEESRDALLLFDASGLVDCNAAAVELFNVTSRSRFIGSTPHEVFNVASDSGTEPESVIQAALETGTIDGQQRFRQSIDRTDGTAFEADIQLSPIALADGHLVQVLVRDVTAQVKQEQSLRLFRRGIEQASHAVLITESDGTIIYANPAFESQTGYDRDAVVGKDPSILKSGKQSEQFYSDLWNTILAGETWEADIVNRRKSGELYKVRQEISPITDDTGDITHFVAIQADVTDRRLREQQLDVLNRVLRHNIRNELSVIQMRADHLRQSCTDAELSHVETVHDRAERLMKLSNKSEQIRSLFRQEGKPEQYIEIGNAITTVVTEFTDDYSNVSIDVDTAEDLMVKGDHRFHTALRELLDNAVVHNDQDMPEIQLCANRYERTGGSEWIDIAVVDNGPGIPKHEREPLETGTETDLQHTTGIDLWIVYWAVSMLGGEMSIETRSPRGTEVVLTLPAATGPNAKDGLETTDSR